MKELTKNKRAVNYFLISILIIFIVISLYLILNTKISVSKNFILSSSGNKMYLSGKEIINLDQTKVNLKLKNECLEFLIEVGEKIDNTYQINVLGKAAEKMIISENIVCSVVTEKNKIIKILFMSFLFR